MNRLWRSGGGRIVRGMLGYALVMAVLATLSPFDFQLLPGRRFAVLLLVDDALLNLMLLFPAGFLYALAHEDRLGRYALSALWLGLLLSLALELSQLLLPSRNSNVVDVLTNGLGAWAGALAERRLGRWLSGFLSDELVLELPLTGSLYLLVPLLMLHGLGVGDAVRAWLALPLAGFGATILASLYQQRVSRAGSRKPARFAVYGALVFAGAALPALLRRPVEVMSVAAAMALLTWTLIRSGIGWSPGQRRFEASTVKRALPWFGLYLLGLVAYPWLPALSDAADAPSNLAALQLLESFAALTVCGYLLSEVTARTNWSARALVVTITAFGVMVGVLLELKQAAPAALLSRLLRLTALGASVASGAALHRAQVTLVRSMRAQGARSQPAPAAPRPEKI